MDSNVSKCKRVVRRSETWGQENTSATSSEIAKAPIQNKKKDFLQKNQIYSTVAGGLGVWAIPNLASRVELTPD